MWKQWKDWPILFSWSPKSLQMVTAAMKLKDACSLEEKLWHHPHFPPPLCLAHSYHSLFPFLNSSLRFSWFFFLSILLACLFILQSLFPLPLELTELDKEPKNTEHTLFCGWASGVGVTAHLLQNHPAWFFILKSKKWTRFLRENNKQYSNHR